MPRTGRKEADTCRDYVLPALSRAGWKPDQIEEQYRITDGQLVRSGRRHVRGEQLRADYVLDASPGSPIGVVEAKREYGLPGDGLQQAKAYATRLDLPTALSTNGHGIVEFDFLTGRERELAEFPRPDELWARYRAWLGVGEDRVAAVLREPFSRVLRNTDGTVKEPRYYQRIAIHRAVAAILRGDKRLLLTMATGTGKTFTAMQIVWKVWRYWETLGESGIHRILVDECHRGSANDESVWREILEYFTSATQLGLTATPKRDANVDTYAYFGNPIYSYSLHQGIRDGFLAPYRVRRVVLSPDARGWSPEPGQIDRFGREIPPKLYRTKDFERVVSLLMRTEAAARYITTQVQAADPMGKTVVFCVDAEHADDMRRALANANTGLMREHPDYVARIVSDEGEWGRRLLARFMDTETPTPVLVTTAKLLATGVDIPTLRTVVLFKPIGSVVEFKQIIGRGTRLDPLTDKLSFEIVDFTGATALFEDPEFDGPPEAETDVVIDDGGSVANPPEVRSPEVPYGGLAGDTGAAGEDASVTVPPRSRKFIVDGGEVYVAAAGVYLTDPATDRLRLVEYRDYVAGVVRRLFLTPASLRAGWRAAPTRAEIAHELGRRGIDLDELAERTGLTEADAFDVLVHLAWNEPVLSRHERARRVRREHAGFFVQFQPKAREVLDRLLERYAVYGVDDLTDLRVLQLEPISEAGTIKQIAEEFGGGQQLREAVGRLQTLLYAA